MIGSYLNIQRRLMYSTMNVITRKSLMNSTMMSPPARQYSTIVQYCAVHNITSSVNKGDDGDDGGGSGLSFLVSTILCFVIWIKIQKNDDIIND